MIVKILGFALWMVIIPFLMGTVVYKSKYCSLSAAFCTGFVGMWALFQVVAVPFILKQKSFKYVSLIFSALCIFIALIQLVRILLSLRGRQVPLLKAKIQNWKNRLQSEKKGTLLLGLGFWCFFLATLLFQLYKDFTLAYADGDDAFYLSISSAASLGGGMYSVDPYTGVPTTLDVRHGLAPFPIWVTFVGKKLGMNPGVVAHSILPLVLIPLTYLIYYEIAKALLVKKDNKAWAVPMFMTFISLLQIFGNYSIYPTSTFLLTRTRQGKEALGNVIIPFMFLLLLWMFRNQDEKEEKKEDPFTVFSRARKGIPYAEKHALTLLMMMTMTAGCLCSTMAGFLGCLLLMVAGITGAISYRRPILLVQSAFGCIPGIVFAVLYFILK